MDAVTADGGAGNACFECLYTTIPAEGTGPSLWGAYLEVDVLPTPGDNADRFPINVGFNFGGCVLASAPDSPACGLDLMQLDACSYAVCLPVCAVPDPGPGGAADPTAIAALNDCLAATDSGACRAFSDLVARDCAALQNEGASGPFEACLALVQQDDGDPSGPAPTASSEAELVDLLCGGG